MLKNFIEEKSGSFAMAMAVVAPIALGTIGLSLDYVLFYDQKNKLQEAADAAALASVRELSLAGSNNAKSSLVQQVAENHAISVYYDNDVAAAANANITVEATPDLEQAEVNVDITYRWAPMFAHFFDGKVTPIVVNAKAKLAGDSLTCVVGLMPPQPKLYAKASVHMDDRSKLIADGCSVISNSTSRFGLRADKDSTMTAQSICSAGGTFAARSSSFSPKPLTDCPKIEDPLESRAAPAYNACSFNNLVVSSDYTLKPGVYCGGLTINSGANVTLQKGIYVIKDGPFIVADTSSLKGDAVGFFLTGENSEFDFQRDTTIDLSAMETGSMAGLLFYEDRTVPHSFEFNPFDLNNIPPEVRLHKISSNNARNLLGTIYLSKSLLLINADAPVADASPYTAIVTGRLWLKEGPILTLNADYTDTTVPVPDGIIGTKPVLVE